MNALSLNEEVNSNKKESWSIGTIEPVLSGLSAVALYVAWWTELLQLYSCYNMSVRWYIALKLNIDIKGINNT